CAAVYTGARGRKRDGQRARNCTNMYMLYISGQQRRRDRAVYIQSRTFSKGANCDYVAAAAVVARGAAQHNTRSTSRRFSLSLSLSLLFREYKIKRCTTTATARVEGRSLLYTAEIFCSAKKKTTVGRRRCTCRSKGQDHTAVREEEKERKTTLLLGYLYTHKHLSAAQSSQSLLRHLFCTRVRLYNNRRGADTLEQSLARRRRVSSDRLYYDIRKRVQFLSLSLMDTRNFRRVIVSAMQQQQQRGRISREREQKRNERNGQAGRPVVRVQYAYIVHIHAETARYTAHHYVYIFTETIIKCRSSNDPATVARKREKCTMVGLTNSVFIGQVTTYPTSSLRTTLPQLQENVRSIQSFATPLLLSVERNRFNASRKLTSWVKPSVVHTNMEKRNIVRCPSTGLEEFELTYTCEKCNSLNNQMVTKIGYEKGVIIVLCHGCKSNVILADNLGWFQKDESKVCGNEIRKMIVFAMNTHELKPKSQENSIEQAKAIPNDEFQKL
ncbi:unnamed protein product, partial [Trichogramma brassicae]